MREKIVVKQNKVISSPDEIRASLVRQAILKVENFFKKKIDFNVVFLDTREELDKIHSNELGIEESKSEDWVVGGYFGGDEVYQLDVDVYSKISIHSQESFLSTLVHEITHIFLAKIFNFYNPSWLNEGIAYVVADQDKENGIENYVDLNKEAFTEEEWSKTNPYLQSGKFVRFLIEKYSSQKLLSLIKALNKSCNKEEFGKIFKEVYGETFDEVYSEWRTKFFNP